MNIVKGVRAEILTLLFLNENEEFYVREIAAKINKSAMAVHLELNKLQTEGIIKSRKLGKLRLASIDRQYHSFKELKSLIIRSYGLPEIIKKSLLRIPQIDSVFIYGSFAKGTVDNFSDIDLFIIGNPNYEHLSKEIKMLENKLGRTINPEIMSASEITKRVNQKDPYILDIKSSKKIYLIHGKSEI